MKRFWRSTLVVSLLFTLVVRASGADPEVDRLRAEVQALLARIGAQEKELGEMKTQQAELMKKLDQMKSRAPASAGAAAAPEAPIAGERLQAESAAQSPSTSGGKGWFADRVRVGGYGSVRFEANDLGGQNFIPSGSAKGFTFRRFVLTTDANITKRLRVYSETEFERLFGIEADKSVRATAGGLQLKQGVEGNSGGEISIEQVWGQYNFTDNHGLRFGVVLPPLGRFNILHDDDYWDLPRRTLIDRDAPVVPVKTAWRDLGAGLVGGMHIGTSAKLDYQFYVLNGARLDFNLESLAQTRSMRRNKLAVEAEFGLTSGFFDGSQSARAVAWRAAFSPSLAGEFALSGYHGRYTPDYLGISEPVNSLGFDYKWRRGAFEFEGEAIYTSFGRVGRVIDAFARTGFTSSAETSSAETRQLESEIEFELSNLARTRYGFWTDFKYNWRPTWLKRTFLGRDFEDPRLVPILRYERVWLNRNLQELGFRQGVVTAIETDNLEQARISLGLSYRPVRNFGIQFAYEHNRRINGDTLVFPRVAAGSTNGFLTGIVFSF